MLGRIDKLAAKMLPQFILDSLRIGSLVCLNGVRGARGYGDFVRSSMSAFIKEDRSSGLPVHVTLEPTNLCNLKCPVCETGDGSIRRARGSMGMDDYKAILDKLGKQVNTMLLYFMGEPFLNGNIYEMIGYAAQRGIWVSSCTNGEFVDAKEVIRAGIGEVSFQLGGMDQKTHAQYRVKGNLPKTLENLNETVREKYRQESRSKVVAGFIVMRHNEAEVDDFLVHCILRGVDDAQVISPCVRTVEQGRAFLPTDDYYWLYDRQRFDWGVLVPKLVPKNSCPWIYYSTVVAWNGDVYPCCRDVHGEHLMGNILEDDLKEIWNGERYREFRRRIATDQANVGICRLCSGFGVPLLH